MGCTKTWIFVWSALAACVYLSAPVTGGCQDSCTVRSTLIIWCRQAEMSDIRDCYRRYPSTRILDLSFTSLSILTNDTFHDLSRINILNLDNIPVSNVSSGSFLGFPDLKKVSLRGIGENVVLFLSALGLAKVPEVQLSKNFENCTCEWRYILSYLRENDISISDYHLVPGCNATSNDTYLKCDNGGVSPADGYFRWYTNPWILSVIGLSIIFLVILCLMISKRKLKHIPPFRSDPQNQLRPKKSRRSVMRMTRQLSSRMTYISICPLRIGSRKPWSDISEYELAATS